MAGRSAQRAPASAFARGRRLLFAATAAVLVVLALSIPAAVVASGPASGQYKLHYVGGGGKGGGRGGPTKIGGSGGGVGLPILILGAAAVASGGAALAYVRWRRRSGATT